MANKMSEDFIKNNINKIIVGDCLEVMEQIPDASIDLIVTSPPYNLRRSKGKVLKNGGGRVWKNSQILNNGYSDYDDALDEARYVRWQRACLTEMLRIIPDNGAIFYIHKYRIQDGLLDNRQEIISGFPLRQIIIWQKNGGYAFSNTFFTPGYEVIFLICKKDFKLIPKVSTLGDIWKFTYDVGNEHPAPFPLKLVERIISTTYAKTVLDPFMGSGTTAVAAINTDRDFIGIELSDYYVKMANKRIGNAKKSLQDNLLNIKKPLQDNLLNIKKPLQGDLLASGVGCV